MDKAAEEENAAIRDDDDIGRIGNRRRKVKRGTLGGYSGGDGSRYMEYSTGHGAAQRHNLFKKRYR